MRDLQKKSTTLFQVALGAWVVTAVLGLAGLAVVIYVAAHFLAKVW